jgi:hypothetical protein
LQRNIHDLGHHVQTHLTWSDICHLAAKLTLVCLRWIGMYMHTSQDSCLRTYHVLSTLVGLFLATSVHANQATQILTLFRLLEQLLTQMPSVPDIVTITSKLTVFPIPMQMIVAKTLSMSDAHISPSSMSWVNCCTASTHLRHTGLNPTPQNPLQARTPMMLLLTEVHVHENALG